MESKIFAEVTATASERLAAAEVEKPDAGDPRAAIADAYNLQPSTYNFWAPEAYRKTYVRRFELGRGSTDAFAVLLNERCAIEKQVSDYYRQWSSKVVTAINTYNESGAVRQLLVQMVKEAMDRGRAHLEANIELRHEDRGPGHVLRKFLLGDSGSKSVGHLETQFAKAQRDWLALFKRLEGSKNAYFEAVCEVKKASAEREMADYTHQKPDEKKRLGERLAKCSERRTRCHLEYLCLIQKLDELRPAYVQLMTEVAAKASAFEAGRCEALKQAVRNLHCAYERKTTTDAQNLDALKQAIESTNSQSDNDFWDENFGFGMQSSYQWPKVEPYDDPYASDTPQLTDELAMAILNEKKVRPNNADASRPPAASSKEASAKKKKGGKSHEKQQQPASPTSTLSRCNSNTSSVSSNTFSIGQSPSLKGSAGTSTSSSMAFAKSVSDGSGIAGSSENEHSSRLIPADRVNDSNERNEAEAERRDDENYVRDEEKREANARAQLAGAAAAATATGKSPKAHHSFSFNFSKLLGGKSKPNAAAGRGRVVARGANDEILDEQSADGVDVYIEEGQSIDMMSMLFESGEKRPALVIYDFTPDAELGPGYLTLHAGDMLQVTGPERNGWIRAEDQNNTEGWAPTDYIEQQASTNSP